jgi:peroxiredoxin
MTVAADASLTARFAALQSERERSWPIDKLRANAEQRRRLVESFDPTAVVSAGDSIVPFELQSWDGAPLISDELLAGGPVALIFFRFVGCPACNVALPHYDRVLVPALSYAGIRTLAVGPHLPERGAHAIAERHDLSLTVVCDRSNRLARRLGLTFRPINDTPPVVDDPNWIGALTGTGTGELPMPAIILVGRDGVIRFADVSPDWLDRTEADAVIAALSVIA